MEVTRGIFLRSRAVGSSESGWKQEGGGEGRGRWFPSVAFRRLTLLVGLRGLPRESCLGRETFWESFVITDGLSLLDSKLGFCPCILKTFEGASDRGVFPRLCPLLRVEVVPLTPFLERLVSLFGVASVSVVSKSSGAGCLLSLELFWWSLERAVKY
jgi:hypothetical protein